MEGFLLKKGWFNKWKKRYVTCSDKVLSIYKKQGNEKDGSSFNLMDCSVKRIDSKRWNKQFVFRLKIAGKRIYLAAEDDASLHKWMTAIKGKVARASLLGANAILSLQAESNGHSTMALLSKADGGQFMSFQVDKFIESYESALSSASDAEAQFKFAEVCGEFLALAHSQGQGLFRSMDLKKITGLSMRLVEASERKKYLKRMKGVAALYKKRNANVILPLQCLVDFGGRTIFVEVAGDEATHELSPEDQEKIASLGIESGVEAFKDKNGRIWITSVSESGEGDAVEFVKALDRLDFLVFDSQSLTDVMQSQNIPVRMLPKMAEMSTVPGIRILMQTEMIARTCKDVIASRLRALAPTEWTTEIVKCFDLILGNNQRSAEFWKNTLEPAIKTKFGVSVSKDLPLLYMPQLFFSLQFHTGADFKDITEYDFTQEHPVLLEHLNAIHAVPHHFLVRICAGLRDIADNGYKMLSDGFCSQASETYNNKVSMFQSIYGDGNIFVASCLSQLSQAYVGIGDNEKAILCAKSAIGAGRHIHAALVPAYLTLVATSQKDEIDANIKEAMAIVRFQLGESHWFVADIQIATASAHQALGNLEEALKYSRQGTEIVEGLLGPDHPKTARCKLIQAKIHILIGEQTIAQPLIEQALNTMKKLYSENSVQVAECEYELADVLFDLGKAQEAQPLAIKAMETRKAVFEADNTLVMASVQQLAIIYDTLGETDKAFEQYMTLINFLKGLEDESIFEDMVKVMRNILCLLLRTSTSDERKIISKVKRRDVSHEAMKEVFQRLIDNDPIEETRQLFQKCQSGHPGELDELACIYHIAIDELSSLSWLDEH